MRTSTYIALLAFGFLACGEEPVSEDSNSEQENANGQPQVVGTETMDTLPPANSADADTISATPNEAPDYPVTDDGVEGNETIEVNDVETDDFWNVFASGEGGDGLGNGTGANPFSHDLWNDLLKEHVTSSGKVDYKGFKNDKTKLQEYLDLLSDKAPEDSWSSDKELAYWINVYNAFTVKLIVDNYPCSSITDLEGGKPWDKKFITIGTKTYSLNQVENDIIREFGEPRIHFAVNCASGSCTKLLNKAFTESNLDAEMDKQTKYYINDAAQNKLTATSIEISQIFNWYKDDFGGDAGVITFINKFSNTKVNAGASISYKEYDWSLND